ncbi:MAG: hypothetical protein V2I33_15320 [Kangiellaceae bacterium]|jgi:hypothetical protein|nr:hypothetical protein [Kangiellaceae bacterium]
MIEVIPQIPRSSFTPAHVRAALNWFIQTSQPGKWDLSIDEQVDLLGGIKKSTYSRWKHKLDSGEEFMISRDTLERLSLLLGIYKGLKMIAPSSPDSVAYDWFKTPNQSPMFCGQSLKEYILTTGTVTSLYNTQCYVESLLHH